MVKVRNVVTAFKAQANPQAQGIVDIFGSFDNLIQPMFPFPMANLSIVLTMENMTQPTMLEVRINAPDEALITKGEFGILPDPFGVGKKIIDLEKFLVSTRGRYTIDVFEKTGEDKVRFISTEELFIAEYPPQRNMSEEEKAHILSSENLIKTVRTEIKVQEDKEPIKLQLNLDENMPIDEGYIEIPKDNKLVVEDKTFDLTGIRRQIEWLFGNPIPQNEESDENTEK